MGNKQSLEREENTMLMFIAILNLLISTASFYLAWKIWRLRRVLKQATKTLTRVERRTYWVLHDAPELVIKGKTGTRHLRKSYSKLESQLRQLEQIFFALNWVSKIWRFKHKSARPTRRWVRQIFP